MKPLIISFLLAFSFSSLSQISFFKKINDVEQGSYPSNFTEFKGEVYFTIETINGTELWKTNGQEESTVKFIDKTLAKPNNSIKEPFAFGKVFLICNNELFFRVINQQNPALFEIWKTDGVNNNLVSSGDTFPQFCINGTTVIETSTGLPLKNIPLNDKIIHFESRYNPATYRYFIDIKKRDNQNNDELIASIDSAGYYFTAYNLYESNSYKRLCS